MSSFKPYSHVWPVGHEAVVPVVRSLNGAISRRHPLVDMKGR